jgi:DNA-binding IclR family transcriptional regulator
MLSSLDRALTVLKYLAECDDEIGVRDIGRHLNLNEATAYRIVKTLEAQNFVFQNKHTKKYSLGIETMRIGQACAKNFNLLKISKVILRNLSEATNESVFLMVANGNFGVYADSFSSKRSLRIHAEVGQRTPLLCGAAPKALLANLPQKRIDEILEDGSDKLKPECTLESYLAELQSIRKLGYSISQAELDEGVLAIGAPIFGMNDEVIASVSIPMPSHLVDDEHLARVTDQLLQACQEISRLMGYRNQ